MGTDEFLFECELIDHRNRMKRDPISSTLNLSGGLGLAISIFDLSRK